MEVPDSASYFNAVTGRGPTTTKEYFNVICTPHMPSVLLQVLLLGETSISPESGAQALNGVLAAARSTHPSAGLHTKQQQLDGSLRPTQVDPSSPASLQPPETAAAQDDRCRTTKPQLTESGRTGSVLPDVTHPVLAYSLWSNRAADECSALSSSKAATGVYNEAEWMEDLEQLLHEAQVHL